MMIDNKFELVNADKVHRAIFGTTGRGGIPVGGVGEGASSAAILAEYDRLGGLIRLNSDTVKMGSFYDFKGRKVRDEADVKLVFKVNGKTVEVAADEPLPPIVRAAKQVAEEAEADTLSTMTLPELKDYAADKNIDLGNAKTKAAVLAVIRGESEQAE